MLLKHKRLICTLCAAQAAICMMSVPVSAEVCSREEIRLCGCAEDTAGNTPVLLAADENEDSDDSSKSTLKEKTEASWQIFACIGGGVLVVVAIISLLADKKKK